MPIIALLASMATTVHATEISQLEALKALSIEDLSNIQITSVSRRPETLSQAPAAIFVITNDDIRRSGATSLPEALRLAPNLNVEQVNAYQYSISARGFNSIEAANKLLVLVDGRTAYSPIGGQVYWESLNVMLADVDRIEVISGPGGTLYGANAVNGVINIITRDSHDTQGGLADVGGGTADKEGNLRWGGKVNENLTYRAYVMGYDRGATRPASLTTAASMRHDGFQGKQTGFRADGGLGNDTYTLQGDIYKNAVYDLAYLRAGGNVLGRWTHQLGDGSTAQIQAYYNQDDTSQVGLRDTLETFDLQAQHDFTAWSIHRIVWGAEGRIWQDRLVSSQLGFFASPNSTINLINGFAQDEISIFPDLKFTLGIKGEYNSYSGFDPLPNARLAWQVDDHTLLWTAVSRAVRTPSRIDQQLQEPGILLPSPNFQTEKLTSYELGFRSQPTDRLSFSISTYYNVYNDIRTAPSALPSGGLPVVLGNGLQETTYGVEAWATYSVFDWWRLKPGASALTEHFHLKSGATDLTQFQALGQDPHYQMQLRSEMNVSPTVEIDLALRQVGRPAHSLLAAYTEADARIGWHVTSSLELSLEGLNLLHPQHQEVADASAFPSREIPRSVMVRLRAGF